MTHIIDRIDSSIKKNNEKRKQESISSEKKVHQEKLLRMIEECDCRVKSVLKKECGPYIINTKGRLEAFLTYSILVIYGIKFSVKSEVHHSKEKFEEPFKYNDYKRVRYLEHFTCFPAVFHISRVKHIYPKDTVNNAYKTLKDLDIGVNLDNKQAFYLIKHPNLKLEKHYYSSDESHTLPRKPEPIFEYKHLELFDDLKSCFHDYKLKIKFREVLSDLEREEQGSEVILNKDKTGIIRKNEITIEPIKVSKGGWLFISVFLLVCLFANFA